ncbi:ATP-binding protein [Aromatoleum toluclasticum]|uniref:AAA family ATPase n=1 Tax=Aromatoleum toluclasticum TaxID=92003 RepID=UPI001D185265|nr:ATP-binding protein [Aromatoleum toluclasticum]MCC4118752.1 ATP-binding protein [Aromatoleum toluclasticum]
MALRINPFKPNNLAPVGMFAGRIDELRLLEGGLNQTKHGEPTNFLITGDRGIGKSSLLLFLDAIAKGDVTGLDGGKFNFIVISLNVSDKMNLLTFMRIVENNVRREIGKTEVARKFLADTWSFVQRLRVMDSGISGSVDEQDEEVILDEFASSLAETCNRIVKPATGESKKDGILFIIDEADNAIPELRLGYFIKTVTEDLQKNGCNNVMFVVTGLPETVEKLKASHESSVRAFHPVKIKELLPPDRKRVVDLGIKKANEINSEKTSVTEDAKEQISSLSEGYPHFIQQFAYCAFKQDTDLIVDSKDVMDSAFAEGGALDSIGNRYYESDFYEKIKSDEYRQVLTIMSKRMNSWIKKAEIRAEFTGPETKLTNALKALTDRRIILKNKERDGEYRLQQRGFALWIQLFGNRK